MTPLWAGVTIRVMKKLTVRRHGYNARAERIERILCLTPEKEVAQPERKTAARLTTSVIFQPQSQSYLWSTDRGRSRLIKH